MNRTPEVIALFALALTIVTIVGYEIIRRRQERRIARLEARLARVSTGRPGPIVLARPTRVDVRGYSGAQR